MIVPFPKTIAYLLYVREIKKYQWGIQGKGKSTITDKPRRTARTRQEQHRHNIKNSNITFLKEAVIAAKHMSSSMYNHNSL